MYLRAEKNPSNFRTVRILFSVFQVTPAKFTSVGGNTECHEYLVGFVYALVCMRLSVCACMHACGYGWVDQLCSYTVHFLLTAILSLEVGLCSFNYKPE